MAASTSQQTYRHLLRHLKSLPTPVQNPYFKNLVHPKRKLPKSTNLRVIKSYVATVASVTELNYLRGLDTGEKLDPRDKIRATSRRVGLDVPLFADEFEEKEKSHTASNSKETKGSSTL